MAAQGGQSHLLHAVAGRRLEHLLRRPGRGERHHQGLSRAKTGRRAGHRSAHAARARSGPEPRRRAADEHVLQALPGAARPVPVGIRADHSVRGDAHRQMVSREFLGDEQLVRAPCSCRWRSSTISSPPARSSTNVNLDELYPEGIHERDLALAPDPERLTWRNFFLWLDRLHKFAEWFARAQHPSLPQTRAQEGRAMDARTVRRLGRPGGHFPGDAQLAHRAQGAGLSGRPSAGRPRRARVEEAGARNRRQRAHRALLLAGLGHGHRHDLPARIRRARPIIPR